MQDNNPLATTNKKPFVPNKGFQIWSGDTYVGYVVIGEKNTPKETVEALQQADNMAAVLAMAELRAFKPAEDRDTTSVMDIIGAAKVAAGVKEELAKQDQE